MNHDTVCVTAVQFLGDHRVELVFDDGARRERDLGALLTGPIFKSIRDNSTEFRSMTIDAEFGVITWPNGADFDAELLRYDDLWNAAVGAVATR